MAQQSLDVQTFYRHIEEESQNWETEGLLTSDQRLAILKRYEVSPQPEPTPSPTASATTAELPLFIRVLTVLAVVLIGMAVFLLISFNWSQLSGAAKLTFVGAGFLASHAGAMLLRVREKKNWAEAVYFLSGILFGVAIWQIGQVFHLPADFPLGMLIWATGVFLLALVLGSTPLHLLAVGLLGGWVLANIFGMNPNIIFWFRQFAPVSSVALPLFVLVGILSGMLRKNKIIPILYTLLFLFWWILQGIPSGLGNWLSFHVAVSGLICITASDWLPKRSTAAISLWRLGAVVFLGGLIGPSFAQTWPLLLYYGFRDDYRFGYSLETRMVWNFLIPALDFLLLFGLYFFPRRKEPIIERLQKNAVLLGLSLGTALIWILPRIASIFMTTSGSTAPYYSHYNQSPDTISIFCTIAVNLLMLVFMVWMIQIGLKRKSTAIFFSGIVFFLIWAIIRYVDLFSGFGGMLGAAAVFFFCAFVLLGIVYYWSTRRVQFASSGHVDETEEPFPIPVWFENLQTKTEQWRFSKQGVLSAAILVALLQFSVLGLMVGQEMIPHVSGTTISVSPIPVDPRDLFRGDYVILRYPFSTVRGIPGSPGTDSLQDGQTVYVSMVQDGELWQANGLHSSRPDAGTFLRGTLKKNLGGGEIVYGIESYFVQEGKGRDLESAMRNRNSGIAVDLAVAPSGQVSIKTVRIR